MRAAAEPRAALVRTGEDLVGAARLSSPGLALPRRHFSSAAIRNYNHSLISPAILACGRT
jgi:hypothetical protein